MHTEHGGPQAQKILAGIKTTVKSSLNHSACSPDMSMVCFSVDSLQDPLMDFLQLFPVSPRHSAPTEAGLVFQAPVKGILPFLVQHLQIHTVAKQQNSLTGPWLCFGWSQRLLDLPPGYLSGRFGKNRAGGFVLLVQSVLLWGFNNLFLFLTTLGVAQQQLQVRVRAGPFVWLQCFVTFGIHGFENNVEGDPQQADSKAQPVQETEAVSQ